MTKYSAVFFIVIVGVLPAVSQRPNYDPMPRKPAAQNRGFVDSSLAMINRNNTDYGCRIDAERRFFVEQTLKNLDFWVIGITVSLLIISFFMLLHQNHEKNRREIIATGLLTQYHNGWLDARRHADDAIRRHNELVKRTNAAAESTLRASSQQSEKTDEKLQHTDSSVPAKQLTRHSPPANDCARGAQNRDNRSDSSQESHHVEIDAIAQISVLQKQLVASWERENNLKKQLEAIERRSRILQSDGTAVSG